MFDLSQPQYGVLLYLLVFVAFMLLCVGLKGRYWLRDLNNKYQDIPVIMMFAGAFCVLALYGLGSGYSLSFGMPSTEADIEDSQQMLNYMAVYKEQIVSNAKVVNQMIFLLICLLLTLISTRWVRIYESENN